MFQRLQCKQLQQDSVTATATRQCYGNYKTVLWQLQCKKGRVRAITVQAIAARQCFSDYIQQDSVTANVTRQCYGNYSATREELGQLQCKQLEQGSVSAITV